MAAYQDLSTEELQSELARLQADYTEFQARGLKLNMARGKPSPEQLDFGLPMFISLPEDQRPLDMNGEDTRNYGLIRGIPEARQLMGELLGVPAANVIVSGASSLNLMYDSIARAMLFGVRGNAPFSLQAQQGQLRFLCPSPGYDRHFAITQTMGFANIAIPMREDGPDMDMIEQLTASDPSVKGIWCVPKYSNPQGITYSDDVVRRLAALRPAATDFRIYWDNAYSVHDLNPDDGDRLLDLRTACEDAGNPDIWYMFASTSKITFAGSGISALASSEANLDEIEGQMSYQTIGPDKVNQLRHVRWFESLGGGEDQGLAGIKRTMQQMAELLRPKFAVVDETLSQDLDGSAVASWSKPRGGYFISLEGLPGTAKRTVLLAKQAGVVLTDAGATWPGGDDPADSNIRIAPSFPSVEELKLASELLAICVRMAAAERLLAERG